MVSLFGVLSLLIKARIIALFTVCSILMVGGCASGSSTLPSVSVSAANPAASQNPALSASIASTGEAAPTSAPTSISLSPVGCCDGKYTTDTLDGKTAWQTSLQDPYLYFRLPVGLEAGQPLYVAVSYSAPGSGRIMAQYDSFATAYDPSVTTTAFVPSAAGGRFATTYLRLSNPSLLHRENGGTDFRISGPPMQVAEVLVQTVPFSNPSTPSQMSSVTIGASTSLLGPDVSAADFTLASPDPQGGPINAAIFGYEWQYHNAPGIPFLPQNTEIPMFVPYDRDNPVWWDEQVDELSFARTPFVLLTGRNCLDLLNTSDERGIGNMCPRNLSKMVDAVHRAGAENTMRFGMMVDTGAMPDARRYLTNAASNVFDMRPVADSAGHTPLWYFWDADIQIWFDTVPRNLWYMYNDNGVLKPVISFWSLSPSGGYRNQQGNASVLLQQIRDNFRARYGMVPFFNVNSNWLSLDTSIQNVPGLVGAANSWFSFAADKLPYSSFTYAGKQWGAMVPAYENGGDPSGCGDPCREMPRNHGASFIAGLETNKASTMNIIEGFTDIWENAGSYRSDDYHWDYTNQYLDIMRQYSDPGLASLRFQAEAADDYINATNKPATMYRYHKALGIIPLGAADQGVGWALASTTWNTKRSTSRRLPISSPRASPHR